MNIDFSQMVTAETRAKEVQDKLEAAERDWRNAELARADIQLLKVQDGMTGLGTQKAWREYRIALRDYPTSKDFLTVRPIAPDA